MWESTEFCVFVCVSVEGEAYIEWYCLYAHIDGLQLDVSARFCVQRSAAVGGIFSCFVHELINSTDFALLSILTNAQPACVCLLRHSSMLAEGHRKQHKLSIQLYTPGTIWGHDKILFYP